MHESGFPMLTMDLPSAEEQNLQEQSAGAMSSFSVSWDPKDSLTDGFCRANSDQIAQQLLSHYYEHAYTGNHLCVTTGSGNGQSIDNSFTPTSSSGIYSRDGFAACGAPDLRVGNSHGGE
jgi:hypothetical protein